MPNLTISQVAQKTGLQTSTLRYYEKIGLLPAPKRIGGRRSYSPAVFDQLALIAFAKKAGFSLREIHALKSRNPTGKLLHQSWHEIAQKKSTALDLVIAQAQQSKISLEMLSKCRCRDIDECGRQLITLRQA
jgi:MerR family redox-sensitive transcriptional activator SoxR